MGHGLNFALGALGAFVHPLRLTFVEFYKNVNFRGGGGPTVPSVSASVIGMIKKKPEAFGTALVLSGLPATG